MPLGIVNHRDFQILFYYWLSDPTSSSATDQLTWLEIQNPPFFKQGYKQQVLTKTCKFFDKFMKFLRSDLLFQSP